MRRIRLLAAAGLLAWAGAGHAVTDAEVRQWLDELVGSALVLQELSSSPCSGLVQDDRIDVGRWYSWGASLASPAFRASAEGGKAERLRDAAARARQWVATEARRWPQDRVQNACRAHAGMFRTIRLAAEAELEDIEYRAKGRVTPRAER